MDIIEFVKKFETYQNLPEIFYKSLVDKSGERNLIDVVNSSLKGGPAVSPKVWEVLYENRFRDLNEISYGMIKKNRSEKVVGTGWSNKKYENAFLSMGCWGGCTGRRDAFEKGHFLCLRYLYEKYKGWGSEMIDMIQSKDETIVYKLISLKWNKRVSELISYTGKKKYLEHVFMYGCPIDPSATLILLKEGHFEAFEWFMELIGEQPPALLAQMMDCACSSALFEAIKYLREKSGVLFKSKHLEILCEIPPLDSETENNIVRSVSYILDEEDKITKKCYDYAIERGNLSLLRLLHEKKNLELSADLVKNAAKYGHMKIVKYLRDIGCPWSVAVSMAASGSNLETFKYCYENGCPVDMTDSAVRAIDMGKLDILEYIDKIESG